MQDPAKNPDAVDWYQAFPQDIIDSKTYKRLEMPVLGLGATGYPYLRAALTPKAATLRFVKIENSGHFMPEEQPEVVARALIDFFH